MSDSLNLALTNELRAFVDQNSGNGTLYSTPSEFVRALLREKKDRLEAEKLRESIIAGYNDVIAGRTIPFSGNLKADMKRFKKLSTSKK
jgi:antitoxin ParD1/3/4